MVCHSVKHSNRGLLGGLCAILERTSAQEISCRRRIPSSDRERKGGGYSAKIPLCAIVGRVGNG